jgi:hypothetical protein
MKGIVRIISSDGNIQEADGELFMVWVENPTTANSGKGLTFLGFCCSLWMTTGCPSPK